MIKRPTKCKYKFCPNEVPIVTSGHQPLYCSAACKQAEYRRRNPDNDRKGLRKELSAVKTRVRLLEKFAIEHAPHGYRLAKEIGPVALSDFTLTHGTAKADVERAIAAKVLKPIDGKLDADGQESFYRLFNGLPGWYVCPDCPHGVIP